MARCLPPEGSQWLRELHEDRGVRVQTEVAVEAIRRADGALSVQARCAGEPLRFDADLVLAAVGIAPATAFLEGSGVALDNGVLTDAHCRNPAAPWCYAVGDVANSFNPLYGRHVRQETWRNAENQARAVAAALPLVGAVCVQIVLGILTLLSGVKIDIAVAHQGMAVLLLAAMLTAAHRIGEPRPAA